MKKQLLLFTLTAILLTPLKTNAKIIYSEPASTNISTTTNEKKEDIGEAYIKTVDEEFSSIKAPTKIKLSNKKPGSVKITYKDDQKLLYVIEISQDKEFSNDVHTYKTKKKSITIKGLKKGEYYYIRVKAQKTYEFNESIIELNKYSKIKLIKIKK